MLLSIYINRFIKFIGKVFSLLFILRICFKFCFFLNNIAISPYIAMYALQIQKKIFDNMADFAGRKLGYSKKTFESEMNNLDHNLAIGYLLKSYGRFYGEVLPTITAYTKQCSTMATSQDLALMAATIANYGVNPKTGKRAVDKKFIPYILTHMAANGMYGYSETWMTNIGMPAKSGVGGAIMIVIPNVMGIAIISPPLDKHGNSVKGILAAKLLSSRLHLGMFDEKHI